MTARPDHSSHDAIIAERQAAAFDTPPGGYPAANPEGTTMGDMTRGDAVPTRPAKRELSAYGDHTYSEAVVQIEDNA